MDHRLRNPDCLVHYFDAGGNVAMILITLACILTGYVLAQPVITVIRRMK